MDIHPQPGVVSGDHEEHGLGRAPSPRRSPVPARRAVACVTAFVTSSLVSRIGHVRVDGDAPGADRRLDLGPGGRHGGQPRRQPDDAADANARAALAALGPVAAAMVVGLGGRIGRVGAIGVMGFP